MSEEPPMSEEQLSRHIASRIRRGGAPPHSSLVNQLCKQMDANLALRIKHRHFIGPPSGQLLFDLEGKIKEEFKDKA